MATLALVISDQRYYRPANLLCCELSAATVAGEEFDADPIPEDLFRRPPGRGPEKEALFNEVYDLEHVPNLLKVPGVHAVSRMEAEPLIISIGGKEERVALDGPRYSALYEIDGPHVLVSREWVKAAEAGRWPSEVRPFTLRRHALYKLR